MSDRLDELLTDEEIPKRADVVFYDDYKAMTRNELRVEVRPEVEALRARVRTLEGVLEAAGIPRDVWS